ncbi:hypothetical protein J2Y63_002915 [Shinella sp. BE166]|uniref:hypothetical protein n=1 Tax=Shinella sp. BE166 TaxID=3373918 RepID=UPI003EBFF538
MADESAQVIPGKVKKPVLLAKYGPGVTITFWLDGEKLVIKDASAEVHYYGEHDRRTWVWVTAPTGGGDYCLGMNDSVHFNGARAIDFG